MVTEELIQSVTDSLSPPRLSHTEGVVTTAMKLARRYNEDEHKAELAAWIHDAAREWSEKDLLQYAEGIEVPSGFALIPSLLHGPIAAHLLEEKYGVREDDILNAVRFHTTGRINMSTLEKILCLADAIEPGRNYPGVEELRQVAENDLNLALAKSLDAVILYLVRRNQPIFPLTVMARNDLWEQYQQQQNLAGGEASS